MMKRQEVLTVEIASRRLRATISGCELVAFVSAPETAIHSQA
jgi:hypothetical protein